LDKSQDAEEMSQNNLIIDADATVEEILKVLELSMDSVRIAKEYMSAPLVNGWDDGEVARV